MRNNNPFEVSVQRCSVTDNGSLRTSKCIGKLINAVGRVDWATWETDLPMHFHVFNGIIEHAKSFGGLLNEPLKYVKYRNTKNGIAVYFANSGVGFRYEIRREGSSSAELRQIFVQDFEDLNRNYLQELVEELRKLNPNRSYAVQMAFGS